ncbi:unnamed protein product [Amoebophrya sp. A120]|nr:unnamed protein product [Amoebophrya sp. A120]|eukprot:GSA120T00000713001.1
MMQQRKRFIPVLAAAVLFLAHFQVLHQVVFCYTLKPTAVHTSREAQPNKAQLHFGSKNRSAEKSTSTGGGGNAKLSTLSSSTTRSRISNNEQQKSPEIAGDITSRWQEEMKQHALGESTSLGRGSSASGSASASVSASLLEEEEQLNRANADTSTTSGETNSQKLPTGQVVTDKIAAAVMLPSSLSPETMTKHNSATISRGGPAPMLGAPSANGQSTAASSASLESLNEKQDALDAKMDQVSADLTAKSDSILLQVETMNADVKAQVESMRSQVMAEVTAVQGSITNEARLKEMIEAAAKDFLPPKVVELLEAMDWDQLEADAISIKEKVVSGVVCLGVFWVVSTVFLILGVCLTCCQVANLSRTAAANAARGPGPVVPQVQTVVEEYHYVDDVTTAPPTSKKRAQRSSSRDAISETFISPRR